MNKLHKFLSTPSFSFHFIFASRYVRDTLISRFQKNRESKVLRKFYACGILFLLAMNIKKLRVLCFAEDREIKVTLNPELL